MMRQVPMSPNSHINQYGQSQQDYALANAMMMHQLNNSQLRTTPGSNIAKGIGLLLKKKKMDEARRRMDEATQGYEDQNKMDMARILSAYRKDTPYQAGPDETFGPGDTLPEGLKMEGQGRDREAMLRAMMGAQRPDIQMAGMSGLLAPGQESKAPTVEKFIEGEDVVFKQWTPRGWQEVSRGKQSPQTSVNINQNQGPTTPGWKDADKKFASEYVTWKASGGFADAAKQISQISGVIDELESGRVSTGGGEGFGVAVLPGSISKMTSPGLSAAKQRVEEVVQRNLRLILGAQFTEKEGKMLIERAFDPQLSTQENISRLKALEAQMLAAAKAKQEATAYFDQNGTLQGFQGKIYSTADFMTPEPAKKQEQKPQPTQEDLEFTARKHGMTVEEVRRRLLELDFSGAP